MTSNASPAAKAIAYKLAPSLQKAAREHEPEFVANAGGLIARGAARAVYPVFVREIPVGLEVVLDAALDHLGSLTFADLAGLLSNHLRSKGLSLNASFHA